MELALKSKINPTRISIEGKESFRWLQNMQQSSDLIAQPGRCVQIGDRESDIYELFAEAAGLETEFLARTYSDRKRYPALDLTVLHVQERDAPSDRAPLEWKLHTNLPVRSKVGALETNDWYAMRPEDRDLPQDIEVGLPGGRLPPSNCGTLGDMISIYCILSWRIFWVTMLNRTDPATGPSETFTDTEISVLDHLAPKTAVPAVLPRTLTHYTNQLAKFGGDLAHKGDPPPANTVMWRGLGRLTDIVLGMQLATKVVGN